MDSSSASALALPPAKKKARVEVVAGTTTTLETTTLPLELELVLPFLSATVDLPNIALLNKAGFDAVRRSYGQRRKMPMPMMPEAEKYEKLSSKVPKVTSVIMNTSHDCYVQPWWLAKDQPHKGIHHNPHPIKVQEDGSWILAPKDDWDEIPRDMNVISPQTKRKLSFPEPYRELFDNGTDGTDLVHFSQVNQRLLVILSRWTNRGRVRVHVRENHTPNTRKQLFAVLYDLSKPPRKHPSSLLLLPTFCHKLTETLDPWNYGTVVSPQLGNGHRSRNGKVLAVTTALPLGAWEEEALGRYFRRRTAEVTVFDVTETALVQRCVLEIPIGHRSNDSSLQMTISNCGELLSISSVRNESNQQYIPWRVYDIREKGQVKIIAQHERAENFLISTQFTPDNELLMILPQRYLPYPIEIRKRIKIKEEATSDDEAKDAFFKQEGVHIPHWLAKRMILFVMDPWDKFHYYR